QGIVAAVRSGRRRERSADADAERLPRRAVGPDQEDHGWRSVSVERRDKSTNSKVQSTKKSIMPTTRRDFIKTVGVSAIALASADSIAELIAQAPRGEFRTSKFKGLADISLAEAKMLGASYSDIRFQMGVGIP